MKKLLLLFGIMAVMTACSGNKAKQVETPTVDTIEVVDTCVVDTCVADSI